MTKKILQVLMIVAPISLVLAMASAGVAEERRGLNILSAILALASYGGSLIVISLICDSLRNDVVPLALVAVVYLVNFTVSSIKFGVGNAILALVSAVIFLILWKTFQFIKGSPRKKPIQKPQGTNILQSTSNTFRCTECGRDFADTELINESLFCPVCGGHIETTS